MILLLNDKKNRKILSLGGPAPINVFGLAWPEKDPRGNANASLAFWGSMSISVLTGRKEVF